jgi:hypothetical protein
VPLSSRKARDERAATKPGFVEAARFLGGQSFVDRHRNESPSGLLLCFLSAINACVSFTCFNFIEVGA